LVKAYSAGVAVEKDQKEEMKWSTKAAELGHAEAQFKLGFCFERGRGVAQSDEKAVKWWREAAKRGHAKAQYNLGNCYHNGTGVAQSYEKAFECWQKAANHGLARAQVDLGYCYFDGIGVTQCDEKAFALYHKAAAQGHAEAQYNLGLCYSAWLCSGNMQKTQKYLQKAQAALAASDDSRESAESRRCAQSIYSNAGLASLFRCRNEGCSVPYSEDVAVQSAKLKSCARCRKVAYCSVECQTADWKARHKHECGKEGRPIITGSKEGTIRGGVLAGPD